MSTRFKRAVFGVFFLALLIAAFEGLSTPKAPPLSITFLDGQTITLDQWRGKPVMVTFWATDCASCLKEIPVLVDLYKNYHQQGLEIIGISMYYDPPNHVVEFSQQNALPYRLALDIEGKMAHAFDQTRVTPTTFLISPDGHIAWKHTGLFEFMQIQPTIDAFLHP